MNTELETYLNRVELNNLSTWHKELLRRFVKRFGRDYPVGRTLTVALTKFNSRYIHGRINEDFISWLYYY